MLTRRKRNRNRSKSVQEKRRLLMESFEVRAAAASLSLPFGGVDNALPEMDFNDAVQRDHQYEMTKNNASQQLRQQGRKDVFAGRSKGPALTQRGPWVQSGLQEANRSTLSKRPSMSRLSGFGTSDLSTSDWQTTQIHVGLATDLIAAGKMSAEEFNSVSKTTTVSSFQSPAVNSNSMETPLTFNHETDVSATETISNLLNEQTDRLEVAEDLGSRASEAAVSRVDEMGADLDSLTMMTDVDLASWTSDGVESACGSGSTADSTRSTSTDTNWQFSATEKVDMQMQFDVDDIVQGEKQMMSLEQPSDPAPKSWTTASNTSATMKSFAGSKTHVASAHGFESGVSGETSKSSALSQVAEKEAVLTAWSSMFDDDSVIEAEHLELVQGYMDDLGIESLEEAGTITACDISEQLETGGHVLQPGFSGSSMMMLPAPTGTMPYVMTDLDGTLEVDGISWSADVVRFDEDVLIDTAVIIADTVILDDAVVTLAADISEFIIVANTIIGYGDSLIQWELAGTSADEGHKEVDPGQAEDGSSGSPHETPSNPSFVGDDGGDGADGATGSAGVDGEDAPDVYLYLKQFTLEANTTSSVGAYQVMMPDFDLRGQDGGQGGQGQEGGDGGHGDKGADSDPRWYECHAGVGWGGDGGDGGDGGQGGTGGQGGDGGDLNFYVVDFPQNTYVFSFDYDLSGGDVGDGGVGGDGGSGGEGGDAGDAVGTWCDEEPQRAGDDGENGDAGDTGDEGTEGSRGDIGVVWIDEEEWEEAFTRAYLVSPSSSTVYVGETIVFDTLNLTGDAILTTIDQVSGIETEYDLTKVGDNQYSWTTTTDLDAAKLEVFITRDHDGSESNTYRLELLPIVEEVVFGESVCTTVCTISTDPYEAVAGGQAYLLGYGFRSDSELVYDGVSLGGVTVEQHTDGREMIAFNIPLEATDEDYFIREDGVEEHSVYLNQVSSLADSDDALFTLLKSSGLAFDPSVNAYSFSNGDMADAADGYVTDRYNFDGDWDVDAGADQIAVKGHGFDTGDRVTYKSNDSTDVAMSGLTFGDDYYVIVVDDDVIQLAADEADATDGTAIDISNGTGEHSLKLHVLGTFSEAWDMFETTYGATEVGLKLVSAPTETMINFLLWYGWWAQDGSATCMGLSTSVLTDYFGGVSDQSSTLVGDAVEHVTEVQGHLLSPEVLGSLVSQGYDHSATGDTVDAIVNFFDSGTAADGGDAPVIIMAPDGAVYTDALISTALVVADVVSLFDGIPTLADVEAVLTLGSDVTDMVDSWSTLFDGVGSSHALAPYRVVYDDPADSLPSRIYFYDSNAPADEIFMEIGEDTDGDVTFDYTNMDDGSGTYLYGTEEGAGWTLAHLTTDEITDDVDFLFGMSGWLL